MVRVTAHDQPIVQLMIGNSTECVHGPRVIPARPGYRYTHKVHPVSALIIVGVETTPLQEFKVKKEWAVLPVFSMGIATKQDQPIPACIKGTAAVRLSFKVNVIAGLLFVYLGPTTRWQIVKQAVLLQTWSRRLHPAGEPEKSDYQADG